MDSQFDLRQLQGALAMVQVSPEDYNALAGARMIDNTHSLRDLQGSRFVTKIQLRPIAKDGLSVVATFTACPPTLGNPAPEVDGSLDDGSLDFGDEEPTVEVVWNEHHLQLTLCRGRNFLSNGPDSDQVVLPWDTPECWEAEDLTLANLLLDDLQATLRSTLALAHSTAKTRAEARREAAQKTKEHVRDAFIAAVNQQG